MFYLQLIIVFFCILFGARLKGVGLGIMGGLGLFILTYFFQLTPEKPPFDVILVIIGGVTASMALEAAGGLNYLTYLAEKIIRSNPQKITYIAPFVGYFFSLFTGTSHVTYSILPVISDISLENGIRPERPLAATAVSSLQAIVASPLSAATAIAVNLLSNQGITYANLLLVTFPASLCGVLLSTIVASKLGKDIIVKNDISINKTNKLILKSQINKSQKISVFIFFIGILMILLTSFPFFTPSVSGRLITIPNPLRVTMIMFSIAALIVIFTNTNTKKMLNGKVCLAGFQAIIAIIGVSWLGKTFFINNLQLISNYFEEMIKTFPLLLGFILFFSTVVTTSQAGTLKIIYPVAIALGVPLKFLIGLLPAINAVFFLPGYPTMVAAIEFDKSGTTKIGKYILNHSFMLPGLSCTFGTIFISLILSKLLFG